MFWEIRLFSPCPEYCFKQTRGLIATDGEGLTCSQLALLPALAVVLCHVEALVDDARDGLDLRAELLLDALQIGAVVIRNQVDGQTEVPETTWEPWGKK